MREIVLFEFFLIVFVFYFKYLDYIGINNLLFFTEQQNSTKFLSIMYENKWYNLFNITSFPIYVGVHYGNIFIY